MDALSSGGPETEADEHGASGGGSPGVYVYRRRGDPTPLVSWRTPTKLLLDFFSVSDCSPCPTTNLTTKVAEGLS